MKNLQDFGVQELNTQELDSVNGGGDGWIWWVAEKMADFLVDNYDDWVENGGADQTTYGGIGTGLSGNTAFSGM